MCNMLYLSAWELSPQFFLTFPHALLGLYLKLTELKCETGVCNVGTSVSFCFVLCYDAIWSGRQKYYLEDGDSMCL
jgi:hypothetical protein